MKTLFLMGILFFLGAIATKKPDQTAWDSARDLGAQAQHIISKVQERTAGDPVTADTFRETAEKLVAGSPDYGGAPDISETNILPTEPPPPGGDTFSLLEPEQPSPGIFPDPKAMFHSEEKSPPLPGLPLAGSQNSGDVQALYENATRLLNEIEEEKSPPLPSMPAVPVHPVQSAQLETVPPTRGPEKGLRLARSQNSGDVQALYENASRLLNEIE